MCDAFAIRDKSNEVNETHYPFGRGGCSIRREKARKRAVKLDVIKALRELEISEDSGLWHHRNYFLFMINMRGMNFIDFSFLSKANLYEDRIRYKRHKTKRGQSSLCNHNRRLRSIGKELGLTEPLTTYVARHTFATAGLNFGSVPHCFCRMAEPVCGLYEYEGEIERIRSYF